MLVVDDTLSGLHGLSEALLTVADGVTGTPGHLEEDAAGVSSGVSVSGVYECRDDGSESLLAVPTWTTLSLRGRLPAGTRILDLRSGVLWRNAQTEDGLALCSARWACLARPGTVVLVAAAPSAILEVDEGRAGDRDRRTFGGQVSTVVETRHQTRSRSPEDPTMVELFRVGSYGRTDPGRHDEVQAESVQAATHMGARGLLAEQREAWAARWDEADVEVIDDPELTKGLRLALFHLMGSVADGGEAAVGRGA